MFVLERTGYRDRLYPTPDQERALRQWAGCARAVWNAAVEQRRTAWHLRHQQCRWAEQDRQLTEAKRAHPWLADPHADVLQQTLRDLDRAYSNFFVRRAGLPRFRKKGGRERFRIQSRPGRGEIKIRRVSRRWGEVRVPKLGWIRLRWTRAPQGQIKHLTISRDALGWHVALLCEREVVKPSPNPGPPVGVDLGVVATVALSTGEFRSFRSLPPGQAERLRRLKRRAGRKETARRQRPAGERHRSRRHRRTYSQIARLHARETRIRRDFLHKLSAEIVKNHGVVVLEGLRVRDMTASARGTIEKPGRNVRAKASLNRVILSQGWGELRRQLEYKLERGGGRLIQVEPAHTSQRCFICGAVHADSRRSQSIFACVECGHQANADVNAARNILAAGLGRDSARSPLRRQGDEARTTRQEAVHSAA